MLSTSRIENVIVLEAREDLQWREHTTKSIAVGGPIVGETEAMIAVQYLMLILEQLGPQGA